MPHPLVMQLRFARAEFQRGLQGIPAEDALRRLGPMNCLSWIVGHLADQENRYWVKLAQGQVLRPELKALVGYGRPASQPPLDEMWAAWREVTAAADRYLEGITPPVLTTYLGSQEKPVSESVGTLLLRNIYHYWYHLGEASAIRQQLGHPDLPEFVGDMAPAAYLPEQA